MSELSKLIGGKDGILNLVYQHMNGPSPKSLHMRTNHDFFKKDGTWNAQEFEQTKKYFLQFYTEIQNYVETDLGRHINPVTDYLFKSFIESLTSGELEQSVSRLHSTFQRPLEPGSQFILETVLEKNKNTAFKDYSLTQSLLAQFPRTKTQARITVPFIQHRFVLELVVH